MVGGVGPNRVFRHIHHRKPRPAANFTASSVSSSDNRPSSLRPAGVWGSSQESGCFDRQARRAGNVNDRLDVLLCVRPAKFGRIFKREPTIRARGLRYRRRPGGPRRGDRYSRVSMPSASIRWRISIFSAMEGSRREGFAGRREGFRRSTSGGVLAGSRGQSRRSNRG